LIRRCCEDFVGWGRGGVGVAGQKRIHDGIKICFVEGRGNLDSGRGGYEVMRERMQLSQRRQRAYFQGKLCNGISADEQLFEEGQP
jgi:hypothetical protein